MAGKDVFRKVLLVVVERARPIAAVLIVAGYVGGFLLPLLAKGTFIDENALMIHKSVPSIGCAVVAYVSVMPAKHQPLSSVLRAHHSTNSRMQDS